MLKKYGKFYADWYTRDGKRHRRAFPTKREALAFTRKQQAASRPKARQAHRSVKRLPRTSAPVRKTTTRGSRVKRSVASTAN
jgi:hypothetical protein